MSRRLDPISPAELGNLVCENMSDAFECWVTLAPKGKFIREDGIVNFSSGIKFFMGNGVFITDLASASFPQMIGPTMAPFVEQSLPMFWIIDTAKRSETFTESLVAAEIHHAVDMPGMAFDLEESPLTEPELPDVEVRRVTDQIMLADWVNAAAQGFGLTPEFVELFARPGAAHGFSDSAPMHFLTAYLNGRPVATSSLIPSRGVAGIYCVCTIADARNKGIGGAITQASNALAAQLGFRYTLLQASKMGRPVYERLGFKQVCQLSEYIWNPPVTVEIPESD